MMKPLITLILSLIVSAPNHELNKDPALRAEVAGYFAAAGQHYDFEDLRGER